ncbi:hypothetical protein Tco_0315778 [Tanacetum coccineum]
MLILVMEMLVLLVQLALKLIVGCLSRVYTGSIILNSGIRVHVNSGTQFKSGASRFNTSKQHVSSVRVNRPVSNNSSPKPSQVSIRDKGGLEGKQHKASCSKAMIDSVCDPTPLHNLHMDLFGPNALGLGVSYHASYCLVITDDVSLVLLGYSFLAHKGGALGNILNFYKSDSMNYIPVSLQNQANLQGSKRGPVTATLQLTSTYPVNLMDDEDAEIRIYDQSSEAQQRSNHKDHQHCLFACFLSQSEPKKVSEALEDESWIKAMQKELLQFKLQQVWILVDLPNGAKVIGTISIDMINP